MANVTSTFFRSCKRLPSSQIRHFSKFRKTKSTYKIPVVIGASATGLICWQIFKTRRKTSDILPVIQAAQDQAGEVKKNRAVTYRQERFYQFASTEFNGNPYMTPQDFLESVTEERPRPRIGRTKLAEKEVDNWLKNTPSRSKGNKRLFRSLHNHGLISYTEYLFLLCVLTKPKSGFHIAFNMFDTDGNQIVDKKEFLVLETFFTLPPQERKFVPRQPQKLETLLALERVFSKQEPDNSQVTDNPGKTDVKGIEPIHDTTLLRHFFGPKGKDVLKFNDFANFMENLQDEVLEIEFAEFSKGMATISEEDFARILLRYTMLDKGDIETCINRVRERMPEEKGLSFKDFKEFCQFLNSLDDFAIAMKMYTYAQQPVSKEQFQRAVKVCTGNVLSQHLVNTVFQIFDEDGDGHLSHKEFISIMKDRLHRGSRRPRSHLMHTSDHWAAFKTCVKNEVKSY